MLWRRSDPQLPPDWEALAAAAIRQWEQLDDAERRRLGEIATVLLGKRWEAANHFAIDTTMELTIALNAALLYLGHDEEPFANVTAVVVHPTTMQMRGPRAGPSPGVVTDRPFPALGHTSARGPVFIAWDTVLREQQTAGTATNVVLHEFAHKLDALDGTMDGTPVLTDRDQLAEWVEVCSAELAQLRRRADATGLLRPYAATNPSEFFSVATEVFFCNPGALRDGKPALYSVFARYYRQDPATRQMGAGA